MKKSAMVLSIFLGLAVFFTAVPVCYAKEPIKVGIIRALTGPAADGGRSQVEALKFVYDKVNREGGIDGRMIEYTVADSKSDPDTSKKLATRFIEVENVLFISGATSSSTCLAITKYAARRKVPVFGTAMPWLFIKLRWRAGILVPKQTLWRFQKAYFPFSRATDTRKLR